MISLGVLLLLLGIVLMVKRLKIAGIIIALLGLGIIAIPLLAHQYVVATTR